LSENGRTGRGSSADQLPPLRLKENGTERLMTSPADDPARLMTSPVADLKASHKKLDVKSASLNLEPQKSIELYPAV
jgi:hypothetical protein